MKWHAFSDPNFQTLPYYAFVLVIFILDSRFMIYECYLNEIKFNADNLKEIIIIYSVTQKRESGKNIKF